MHKDVESLDAQVDWASDYEIKRSEVGNWIFICYFYFFFRTNYHFPPGEGRWRTLEDHMTFRGKGGESTVAHNCHGKTKSHGTTNFTHGKTKFIHGKTKKTSWSAVVISIWNGMSCNSNTLLARKTAIFRARDVLLRVWIGSRWRCKLL